MSLLNRVSSFCFAASSTKLVLGGWPLSYSLVIVGLPCPFWEI